VPLAGWCFDRGITHCFSGGEIAAGGYFVGSSDPDLFESEWGFAPDFEYSGNLSNGGERVRLVTAATTTVDDVTYDDANPWPVRADGTGPSLERIDPLESNDTARAFRASVAGNGATPRAANSVAASGLPAFVTATAHAAPEPGVATAVHATVVGATSVQLAYRVDFGAESLLPMFDDGAHGDGAPADGVYGGEIPSQPLDHLVRYRVLAQGPNGAGSEPRLDDTIVHYGFLLESEIETELPVIHWWIHPDDYQAVIDNPESEILRPAYVVHDGRFWDGVGVRVRGQSSAFFPKKSFKVEFPAGHDFVAPTLLPEPVDELDLQSTYADKSDLREILAAEALVEAGVPAPHAAAVRVQKNGPFYGLYTALEHPDSNWTERVGLDPDGARYKAGSDCRSLPLADLPASYEKRSREHESYSDLAELLDGIAGTAGAERTEFVFDRFDLPAQVNYLAAMALIHNNDHMAKNYFLYRDTEGTGRWTMLPWDLDLTFGRMYQGSVLNDEIWADTDVVPGRPDVSPSHPLFGDALHQKWDFFWNRCIDALHGESAVRAMFHRRLRTLADALLQPPYFEDRIATLAPLIAPESALDRLQPWGEYGVPQTLDEALEDVAEFLTRRRVHLLATHRLPGEIPEAQTLEERAGVEIHEISYLADDELEFLELYNRGAAAVDLSGWTLAGADAHFPPGTVIPGRSHLVVPGDDTGFRAEFGGGRFVPTELGEGLADTGEALVLLDAAGAEIDRVEFGAAAPWPELADGRTLSLLAPGLDNSVPGSWAASDAPGGTPGALNFPDLFADDFESGDTCVWPASEGTPPCFARAQRGATRAAR
jgi:hypothetical protein